MNETPVRRGTVRRRALPLPGSARWRAWLVIAGFATAVGLLESLYKYLDVLAAGGHPSLTLKLIDELSASWGILALLPFVAWWARLVRDRSRSWPLRLPWLAAGLIVFAASHTAWMLLTRKAVFPLTGLGSYEYGPLRLRIPMEAAVQTIVYGSLIAFVYLFDDYRVGQERAAQLARVERELVTARLASLRAQLNPHFLFNALNTISSVMYTDVDAADRMLAGLGDLLRHALATSLRPEISLGDELDLLESYLKIVRARFGDQVLVDIAVATTLRRAAVPQFALQPLVENAVSHGRRRDGTRSIVTVTAARTGSSLRLEVRDNGPGLGVSPEVALASGLGLSNTVARLSTLYGSRHRVMVDSLPEGGTSVALELPYREMDDA
jgi:two-component system, LytTR family, sensor kinase